MNKYSAQYTDTIKEFGNKYNLLSELILKSSKTYIVLTNALNKIVAYDILGLGNDINLLNTSSALAEVNLTEIISKNISHKTLISTLTASYKIYDSVLTQISTDVINDNSSIDTIEENMYLIEDSLNTLTIRIPTLSLRINNVESNINSAFIGYLPGLYTQDNIFNNEILNINDNIATITTDLNNLTTTNNGLGIILNTTLIDNYVQQNNDLSYLETLLANINSTWYYDYSNNQEVLDSRINSLSTWIAIKNNDLDAITNSMASISNNHDQLALNMANLSLVVDSLVIPDISVLVDPRPNSEANLAESDTNSQAIILSDIEHQIQTINNVVDKSGISDPNSFLSLRDEVDQLQYRMTNLNDSNTITINKIIDVQNNITLADSRLTALEGSSFGTNVDIVVDNIVVIGSSATINFNVNSIGNEASINVSAFYYPETNVTGIESSSNVISTIGAHSAIITSLIPGTTYVGYLKISGNTHLWINFPSEKFTFTVV